MYPGWITLTLIRSGASSSAAVFASCRRAHFAIEYAEAFACIHTWIEGRVGSAQSLLSRDLDKASRLLLCQQGIWI